MNWDRVQGNWKQFKGSVREKWAKLTDDHVNAIGGRREVLSGKLQEAYGIGKQEAERQIGDWQRSLSDEACESDDAYQLEASPRKVNSRH
jgi:uncharacterized protein YjbJ (UPF0337 family)